jgi:hypothetical protein
MDRWYLSTPVNQPRATALNCSVYGKISPWQHHALGTTPLPAVLLANGQSTYATLHDDGTITSSTIDTLAAPYLAMEQTQATRDSNEQAILDQGDSALADNANYLGITHPTQPQIVAQVAALTRQIDGLIRLRTEQLDSTT